MTAFPSCTSEQGELLSLLASVTASPLTDATADAARSELDALGLWTLGVPESAGGGGADAVLTATVFAGLGRSWAALGWGSVQAHAAALVGVPAGPAAVVDLDSPAVSVSVRDGRATGTVDRLDPAGTAPSVLVLASPTEAWLIGPAAVELAPLRRTGLAGAMTSAAVIDGPASVLPADTAAVRTVLRLGAAAVAAGIASAAADAALAYSRGRRQFGGPLTDLPTVRESLLASSGAAATLLRQVLAGAGGPPWQAAAILDRACEAAIDAAAASLQSHGGYGYLTEYPAERLLRDAVSLRAAADTATARRQGAAELTPG